MPKCTCDSFAEWTLDKSRVSDCNGWAGKRVQNGLGALLMVPVFKSDK